MSSEGEDVSGLKKQIFEDSDDKSSRTQSPESTSDHNMDVDEEEEEPASSSESEKDEKRPKSTEPSGLSEKILEARREFDEALGKIKSTGGRRGNRIFDTGAPVDLDDIAETFVKRMARAADTDCDSIEAGKPALEKQKMVSEVVDMLTKRHYHEVLLDNDLLGAVRRWLEPMPNRTLPSPNIRKAILELLKTLPIETVHLRESGLGKIVNFFNQRPGEMDDIRRLASELVTAWARPVLQRQPGTLQESKSNGHGHVLRSETLKSGAVRRYSGGSVQTRQQKKIVQSLAKKRTRPSTNF